jgi:endonuclease G, mitochondrial
MKRFILTPLIISLSFIHLAFGQQDIHLPKSVTGEQIVNHTYYTLSYNEKHEQASWVAYELTKQEVLGNTPRKDAFRSDPSVTTASASLSDYKGSGYDRGHLAPAADMKMNTTSMSESFFMTNMSPQAPSFNRGVWKKLEALVRSWAVKYGKIYIATGGILTDEPFNTIGTNKVSIPKYYYKVILKGDLSGGIAFILPNQKSDKSLKSFVVSIDEVESLTGIDFFYQLEDSKENALESSFSISNWTFTASSTSSSYKTSNASKSTNTTNSGGSIYICNSSGATTYHNNRNCSGLNRCKSPIIFITEVGAINKGRRKCKICY